MGGGEFIGLLGICFSFKCWSPGHRLFCQAALQKALKSVAEQGLDLPVFSISLTELQLRAVVRCGRGRSLLSVPSVELPFCLGSQERRGLCLHLGRSLWHPLLCVPGLGPVRCREGAALSTAGCCRCVYLSVLKLQSCGDLMAPCHTLLRQRYRAN